MKQFILVLTLLFGSAVYAQNKFAPKSPQVRGDVKDGAATFERSEKQVIINITTERSLINFIVFSTEASESVVINQPSSNSVAILRLPVDVNNFNQYLLKGKLRSNGKLVLVAPVGTYIDSSATVEAASIFITTADMKESDWQSDEFRFEDVLDHWGQIKNYGKINSTGDGFVIMAGDRITNEGTINAGGGSISLITGSAFTLSLPSKAILKDSIRMVEKKQSLLNGLTKATVIYNGERANLTASNITIDVNIDNNDGQTPIQLGGFIRGNLQISSKARGWLWMDGNMNAGKGSINATSSDDVWFSDNAKIFANSINVKAEDEIRCQDNLIVNKMAVVDASSDNGDGGKITFESRRMILSGRMLALGQGNGGEINLISSADVRKLQFKTDVAGKTGKPGSVNYKRR